MSSQRLAEIGRPESSASTVPSSHNHPGNLSPHMKSQVLRVEDLRIAYRAGTFAVDGLNFQIAPGEAVALVGESGCGKSTTAMSILKLLPTNAKVGGKINFGGLELASMPDEALRKIRGRQIGVVFQEPMSSLNPVYPIGRQIAEVLREHLPLSRRQARSRVVELLELVKMPDPARRVHSYPHELSGGQKQRVVIAMAIACNPTLLIADEPTTALDATVQSQILELIDELRRKLHMGLLLISHDLPLVARWTDRVIVMHHGKVMETLQSSALFDDARHPYTRGLIGSSPRILDRRHYRTDRLSEVRSERLPDDSYRFELITPAKPQPPVEKTPADLLLSVRDLNCVYQGKSGPVTAVDNIQFDLRRGETLGLVGESGSGKSTLGKSILGLVRPQSGTILFEGQDVTKLTGQRLRAMRRQAQMVFQDPYSSLNPRRTVYAMLDNLLLAHGNSNPQSRRDRIFRTLDQISLPRRAAAAYPHQFSGGQRQRIAIARALVLEPKLLICDEPVSALDVSIQAQILNLLADLQRDLGISTLFISHDLAVVQFIADRIVVMANGGFVEERVREADWAEPVHPYTRSLFDSKH